jgi:CheY-like chemotaxis protein
VKKILIIDDDAKNLARISEAFGSYTDLEVLTARRANLAAQILNLIKVDMVITDVDSPEVNGLKFVSYLKKKHPGLSVSAMGSSDFPKISPKLDAVGISQYFHKPIDLDGLVKTLADKLDIGAEGRIHGISLPSFLQLVNMEEKTCTLKVQSGCKTGYIYCISGDLIAAETGSLNGKEALFEIMFWEQTSIQLEEVCKKQDVEITEPLTYLLMESHRARDEKESEESLPASHPVADKDVEVLSASLEKHPGVYEYAIFDDQNNLKNHHSQAGSVLKLMPSLYADAADETKAFLHAGMLKYVVLHTKGGVRYSLFDHKNYRIAVALKPGVKPADFIKDVRREL